MKVDLMKVADIPAEGSKIVLFLGEKLHAYLADGIPCAVANVGLHFDGPLECQEGVLVCPWHNTHFEMHAGQRIYGPASKDSRLMRLSTRVEGDALFCVWGEAK